MKPLAALTIVTLVVAIQAQAPPAPNVLLITLDTVRADRIGAYGYTKGATPTIDRLAREGVRFADATTQAPLTGPAHAALLTGLYPARLGVRDNATTPLPADVTTIAEQLRAKGYETGAFVGAFVVGAEYGFGQGFDHFDGTFSASEAGMRLQAQRRAGEVVDSAVKWLGASGSRERAAAEPFFAWVHLYDAHTPYEPPPPYAARFKASPYDGEIAAVDAAIGRLITFLEQQKQLDRTAIVVVADHGEGLGDHGEAEHGVLLYESVLRIPWIMRLPAREAAGTVVPSQVRAIDVAPTIAALAGIEPVPRVDGGSVLPLVHGRAPLDPPPSYAETFYPRWHFGWSEITSIRVGDFKYIDAPRPELYDMRADPMERRNLIDARGPLAAGLSSALAKLQQTVGGHARTEAPQPDPETLARLRSLGYISLAAPTASGPRGADPKDMIAKVDPIRDGISRAMEALSRGQPDAAIPILRRLLADNERSYELHLFLGDAYAGRQQHDRALGEYAAAAVLNPNSAAPIVSAARVHLAQGDTTRALQRTEEAGRLDPSAAGLTMVRGMIFEARGDGSRALSEYDSVVRSNGSDTQARARLASLAMRLKRYDVARPQFESLLKMGYRRSRMHFGLGQIAEAQGNMAQAAAEYRRAIQLEPAFADARTALSRVAR